MAVLGDGTRSRLGGGERVQHPGPRLRDVELEPRPGHRPGLGELGQQRRAAGPLARRHRHLVAPDHEPDLLDRGGVDLREAGGVAVHADRQQVEALVRGQEQLAGPASPPAAGSPACGAGRRRRAARRPGCSRPAARRRAPRRRPPSAAGRAGSRPRTSPTTNLCSAGRGRLGGATRVVLPSASGPAVPGRDDPPRVDAGASSWCGGRGSVAVTRRSPLRGCTWARRSRRRWR